MKAYGFGSKGNGTFEIEDTLENLQEYVGGYIEVIGITENIDLVCNDEGKLMGLDITAALINDDGEVVEIIAGDCFLVRNNGEGEFESIKDEDADIIKRYVKKVTGIDPVNHILIIEN